MEPDEIRLELYKRRRQVMQKDIAASLGVTSPAVTAVIDRRFKSRRIAEAIAAAIERPFDEVFPEQIDCEVRRTAACG